MQDFWDFLAGKDERPASSDGPAKAEARTFATCLRLGKMSLHEVCETIAVSENEAAELAAFIEKYPSEEIIVESAIEFRSLVATQLDRLLRGGHNVFPVKSRKLSDLDFLDGDDRDGFEGIV